MIARPLWALVAAVLLLLGSPSSAQNLSTTAAAVPPHAAMDVRLAGSVSPISLKEAVALALEKNPLRKAAAADRKIAGADVREAKSVLWPRLTFTESATRGNDPVYAFGTRLRQGRFTTADFALNRLNQPLPLGNFTSRFSAQWNLFHAPDWLNVRRTERMQEAAAQHLERADQEVIFRVVNAYYALLLAGRQQELAQQQVHTAESILAFSKARYESGMVVEADYLGAQVNHAARQQELIRARNAMSLAQVQLNTAMGVPAETACMAAEVLAERSQELLPLADAEKRALAARPDFKQITLQEGAAAIGTRMATAAFAPRINAFAGWEQDNPAMFGGGSNNWAGGIEIQFDLFSGGQKTAQLQRARAMEEKLAALRQAAADTVRLEVHKAWLEADSSRQQLEVARASISQAEESLRISQTRYESGLTTITELLRAEEATRRTRTDYWQAVYGLRTAFANLDLAMGTLTAESAVAQ